MLLSCKTQILIWQLSLKAQIIIWHYFHKAQIIIWQLFLQKPKSILATIPTKAQSLFWQLFHKAQNTILAKTITLHLKPKCYFGTYLQNANIILTLVLHLLNLTLMGNIIIHPSRNTSLTRFIKVHEYHPWQNYSFCRDNQAQGRLMYIN